MMHRSFSILLFSLFITNFGYSQNVTFFANFEGTLVSSESEDPLSAMNVTFTSGIIGQGLLFPPSGVLQYSIMNNLDVTQGSVSLWVKPNWEPNTLLHRIMVVGNDPRNFEIHVDEGSNLAFAVNTSQIEEKPISVALQSVAAWATSEWHNLVFTWDSSEIGIFLDGNLLGSALVGFEIPNVSDKEFHIGSYFGENGFDGVLDELMIYDRPLTALAIKETYESTLWSISKTGTLSITDVFGRDVTNLNLELVDWEGFIRNPAFKYFLHPPDSVSFPLSIFMSANHGNAYFNQPSSTSIASGPSKTIIFNHEEEIDSFYISYYPDRNFADDTFNLNFQYFHRDGSPRHQAIHFKVTDEDIPEQLSYDVLVDFSEDTTALLALPEVQEVIKEAARDWVYFVDGTAIDSIEEGEARVWIGRTGNLLESRPVTNKKKYRGLYMFVHGTNQPLGGGLDENGQPLCICSTGYSGDESFQTRQGNPLLIRPIGGHELNILGNFNENGYNVWRGAEDWTFENSTNGKQDLYSLAKHEMGHIIYGSFSYPLHAQAVERGYFSSPEISAYYPAGVVVLLDGVPDHYDDVIDPISLGHAYGGNLGGSLIPDGREIFTKIDLLIMQAIGYPLRPIRAIAPLNVSIKPLISGEVNDSIHEVVSFSGSLPYFNISISKGVLPSGLNLNSFTGEIYGTPTEAGSFPITIKVEEYDVVGKSLEIETTFEITDDLTAIATGAVNTQLKCYPNPSNEFIYLEIDGRASGSAELEMYNLNGHKIFHKAISMSDRKHKIPFSQQPPGAYLVVLRTPSSVIASEIMIKQ